ncbi:MAG: class I SAM-dependent methyltransferase [Chloroflexi bacterium]|nr:class I SAM-dependent methyltransferase [Chloroflexota bacterium]
MAPPFHPDPFVLHLADLLGHGPAQRVLDCGVGTGRNAAYLAACGHRVTGVDQAATMLARVDRRPSMTGAAGRVEVVQARLETLPFPAGAFDALLCTHVLETMRNGAIAQALEEMRRVLRPGGLLLVGTAAREGANPRGGREVEPGTFVFDRQGRVTVHLADREELARWTSGFATVARYLLMLEEPPSAPFCAQWAFFGRRR